MQLLSTSEVARRFNVKASTVSRWVSAGRLVPKYKAPGPRGAMAFAPEDVDALADQIEADRQRQIAVR